MTCQDKRCCYSGAFVWDRPTLQLVTTSCSVIHLYVKLAWRMKRRLKRSFSKFGHRSRGDKCLLACKLPIILHGNVPFAVIDPTCGDGNRAMCAIRKRIPFVGFCADEAHMKSLYDYLYSETIR
eukprot:3123979-Amphidinium_carterae.2